MTFGGVLLWILGGFRITIEVTVLAFLIAAPFAFVFGTLEYRCRGILRGFVTAAIEFWRSSSLIILLFFFYYVLPVEGVHLSALLVGSLVIGLSSGAYSSQAVRGALAAVPAGQVEAAVSLGLSRNLALILIEIPQALRTMLPIFGNEIIELIKTTANVSLITLADMTFRAKEALQFTYQPAEVFGSLIIVYVILCGAASFGFDSFTKRLDRVRAR
jgi:polar amino acid transport system permease protein